MIRQKTRLLLLLLAGASLAGQAQAASLMLNVKRNDHTSSIQWNRPSATVNPSSGLAVPTTTQVRSQSSSVSYKIELLNASTGSVANVEVRWTVVTKLVGSDELQVMTGKRHTALNRGQRFAFETSRVGLKLANPDSSSSTRELIGYLVEACVNGTPVTSAAQPANIRQSIEQARAQKAAKAGARPPTGFAR